MKINKYIPFAFIYFFLNSLGLPQGLTYTTLFTPLFYWWILVTRKKEVLFPFIIFLTPFIIIQTQLGVDTKSYFISLVNMMGIYIFCQTFYTFLKKCEDPERIFRLLLISNFVLCCIALPFYFTSLSRIFWIEQFLTAGIDNFKRLKLFTYEASYYATLFTPIFIFYLLQIILRQNRISAWILLPLLFIPYILSFSLGVISTLLIAGIANYFFHFRSLMRKRRMVNIIALTAFSGLAILVLMIFFFPQNTLFTRLTNIFAGNDNSGRGRTYEAFQLANEIVKQKSYLWGIGPGQIKIIGADIIRAFYNYPEGYDVITIPNVTAETLTIFGLIGLFIRMLVEVSLFFFTKTWANYYRLVLFIFIFIYQFTGSFITNIAEYVIWILAFTNVFPQFDVQKKPLRTK